MIELLIFVPIGAIFGFFFGVALALGRDGRE